MTYICKKDVSNACRARQHSKAIYYSTVCKPDAGNLGVPFVLVMAHSDFTAREDFSCQDRGDTAQANGLVFPMESL